MYLDADEDNLYKRGKTTFRVRRNADMSLKELKVPEEVVDIQVVGGTIVPKNNHF